MRTTPEKWTHEHTHRIYHLSLGVSFTFMALVVLWGILSLSMPVGATYINQSGNVQLTATVGEVNAGPTVIEKGAGSSPLASTGPLSPTDSLNQPDKADTKNLLPQPGINAPDVGIDIPETAGTDLPKEGNHPQTVPVAHETVTLANGSRVSAPVYATQQPQFSGHTNIPNATIYLQVHSTLVINATTYADSQGYWSWQSPEAITPGTHTLTVRSEDPNNPAIVAISQKVFVVKLAAGTPVKPSTQNGLELVPGNGATLFDVLVKIPAQFKQLEPGNDLYATIKLVNFGKAGSPVDVGVEYIITNSDNKTVMDLKETVAVATQISLVKTFYTSATLPKGTYTLTVKAPTKDAIAVASDTFEITGAPVIAITSQSHADFTVVFQALIAMLLFFAFVAYFEYNKVMALSKIIKLVSDQDLKKAV